MTQQREGPDPQESGGSRLDTTIVLRAQAGDEEAFESLYLWYFPAIGIFLTHLVNSEEVGREEETLLSCNINIQAINWPEERQEMQQLRASLAIAQKKLRQVFSQHLEGEGQSKRADPHYTNPIERLLGST